MKAHEALDAFLKAGEQAARAGVNVADWLPETPTQKATPPSRFNIKQDRFDQRMFGDLTEQSTDIKELLDFSPTVREGELLRGGVIPPSASEDVKQELQQVYDERDAVNDATQEVWGALVQDLWSAYYKTNPQMVPEEEVATGSRVNRSILENMMESPDMDAMRVSTVMDELSSGLAVLSSAETLMEMFRRNEGNVQQALEESVKQERAEGQGDQDGANAAQEVVDEIMQRHQRTIRRAMRRVVKKAKNDVENAEAVMAGIGMGDAELRALPPDERLRLGTKMLGSRRLRMVATILGRLRGLARTKTQGGLDTRRDEIHSITLGNDLARLLPSELATLKHPLLKRDFYRRYLERQLLQYELRPTPKDNSGPVVVLVDTSGSMQSHLHSGEGTSIDVALATALALVEMAQRQKRHSAVICFQENVVLQHTFGLHRDQAYFQKLIEVAEVGAGGGTSYDPALDRACGVIEEKGSVFDRADIVLITDGEASNLADSVLRRLTALKESAGLRMFLMFIQEVYSSVNVFDVQGTVYWPPPGHADDRYQKMNWFQLANRVFQVSADGMEGAAGDIFEEVHRR